MSEEDIIDIIKNLSINEYEWYLDSNKYQGHDEEISNIVTKAIQGLLDLYQKEKQKNKKLESRKYMLNAETGEVTAIPIDNNYIPKSRVREKIEELKEILKNNLYITFEHYGAPENCLKNKIEILEELLQEGDK